MHIESTNINLIQTNYRAAVIARSLIPFCSRCPHRALDRRRMSNGPKTRPSLDLVEHSQNRTFYQLLPYLLRSHSLAESLRGSVSTHAFAGRPSTLQWPAGEGEREKRRKIIRVIHATFIHRVALIAWCNDWHSKTIYPYLCITFTSAPGDFAFQWTSDCNFCIGGRKFWSWKIKSGGYSTCDEFNMTHQVTVPRLSCCHLILKRSTFDTEMSNEIVMKPISFSKKKYF